MANPTQSKALPADVTARGRAITAGALAAVIVGGSFPVTGLLDNFPLVTGQAIRYTIGGLVLLAWMAASRQRLPRPSRRDLGALVVLAGVGMIGFNGFVLAAQHYAEPGFVAAIVGCSPLAVATLVAVTQRRLPALPTMIGAALVVAGVAVLSGGGSWHGPGLVISVLALVGEVSFTLAAVGVVGRLGAIATSAYACVVAAVGGGVIGLVLEWPQLRAPSAVELGALVLLGAIVTAVAFGLWYSCVSAIGADKAGVLIGLMPVSGLVVAVLMGVQQLTVAAAVGAVAVAVGCIVGQRSGAPRSAPTPVDAP